ncbi:MAG: hypothetical protein Tp176DCM1853251_41 [Prokaryotic dsDNA virus sp.]|nr:MAG: hypothetical protein Tp176DCM1853251_41 [Prokaryotic dsDNA virus sp.]|tara:strand:- start:3955 stop:4356 length:402 start_codon:yes stop_codon:yes gene_type:complete
MTDIIAFPSARRRIFVCACDCSTFHLCEDGTAECASCGEIAEAENGAWFDATGSAPDRSPDEVAPFSDVQGNGSIDFARARVSGMASDDDAKLVVVARGVGAVHVWSDAETDAQIEWAREMLECASCMLEKKV